MGKHLTTDDVQEEIRIKKLDMKKYSVLKMTNMRKFKTCNDLWSHDTHIHIKTTNIRFYVKTIILHINFIIHVHTGPHYRITHKKKEHADRWSTRGWQNCLVQKVLQGLGCWEHPSTVSIVWLLNLRDEEITKAKSIEDLFQLDDKEMQAALEEDKGKWQSTNL